MPKVKVPAAAGDEVVLSVNGGDPTTYKVSDDHVVTVKEADLPHFLGAVEGSHVVDAKPASSQKG